MMDLYWISVLGNLSDVIYVLLFVSFFITLVLCIACFLVYTSDECREKIGYVKTSLKWAVFAMAVLGIISVFAPNSQQLYAIYGIGGTIDYLKENKEAQKLPDNIIKAANVFLEKCQQEASQKENNK